MSSRACALACRSKTQPLFVPYLHDLDLVSSIYCARVQNGVRLGGKSRLASFYIQSVYYYNLAIRTNGMLRLSAWPRRYVSIGSPLCIEDVEGSYRVCRPSGRMPPPIDLPWHEGVSCGSPLDRAFCFWRAESGGVVDFQSRFFAPRLGIDEDPVTGSAHCCLAPYWAAKLGRYATWYIFINYLRSRFLRRVFPFRSFRFSIIFPHATSCVGGLTLCVPDKCSAFLMQC